MATYTPDQYVKKLNKAAKNLDVKPFYEVTNEVISRIDKRVFDKGIGGSGSHFGKYSSKPLYVSASGKKNGARNVNPRGKDGKAKFKNGKLKMSAYYSGGYGEFKKDIGKGGTAPNVNLWLSNKFRVAFQNSNNPARSYDKGFIITSSIKITGANPIDKVKSILKRYPDAFKLTKGERAYVVKRFREIFIEQFTK
jgi:hypothetical protein